MSDRRIPATGFDDYIDEDQPALYISYGEGNVGGVREVFLSFLDENRGVDVQLGWFPAAAIRDALNGAPA